MPRVNIIVMVVLPIGRRDAFLWCENPNGVGTRLKNTIVQNNSNVFKKKKINTEKKNLNRAHT